MLAVEVLLRLRKRSQSAIKMADINSVLLTDLKRRFFLRSVILLQKCFARHLHKGKTAGNDELKRLRSLNALSTPVQCRLKTDMFSIFQCGYWSCLRVVVSWRKNGRMKRFWVVFVDFSCVLVQTFGFPVRRSILPVELSLCSCLRLCSSRVGFVM